MIDRLRKPLIVKGTGRARALTAAGAVTALVMIGAGCSSSGTSASSTSNTSGDQRHRRGERVRQRAGPDRRPVRARVLDPEQPQHRPAHVRGEPERRQEVSAAQLIVQNGVGYDTFMNKIESASPNPKRKVIVVQHLLGLPDSTPNPHLWYDPKTMPAVAKAMAADLSALQPAHAAYFQANLKAFDESLTPWLNAIAAVQGQVPGHPGRDHRAGRRLPAAGRGDRQPHPVQRSRPTS